MALNPQRMPVPPTPVMPPEGLAPVTQEVGLGAGDDAMSPTTMVLNYLKARGYQPTSENVRRALEANMRDPGVITGLRSDRGATEAEDQAAMAAARGGGGGGGSRLPVPPIPPTQTPAGPVDRHDDTNTASPDTSAAPTNIGSSIISGIPLALAGGAGAYGMYRGAQGMQRPDPYITLPGGENMPPPDPIHGPGQIDYTQMDPAARPGYPSEPMPPPEYRPGQIDYTKLLPPSEPTNPLETALNRAVPPNAAVPPVEPMRPVDPAIAAQQRTKAILDAAKATTRPPATAADIRTSPTLRSAPRARPPRVTIPR